MSKIAIETEYFIECYECGGEIAAHIRNNGNIVITVEPCERCLNKAYNDGYDDGSDIE